MYIRGNRTQRVSERKIFLRKDFQKPQRGRLVLKTDSQKGASQRFLEVLSETLSEEDFPLGDSRCSSCCPLTFLQILELFCSC